MEKLQWIIGAVIAISVIAALTTVIVVGQLIAYGPLRSDCPREEVLGELQGRVVCIPASALDELDLEPSDVGLPGS